MSAAQWRAAARRLVRSNQVRSDAAHDLTYRTANVTAVQVGASADGVQQVTVNVRGSTQITPWIQAYTASSPPAGGDLVAVLLIDKSPVIVGRVVGLPSF